MNPLAPVTESIWGETQILTLDLGEDIITPALNQGDSVNLMNLSGEMY